jgi:hypothetical protein
MSFEDFQNICYIVNKYRPFKAEFLVVITCHSSAAMEYDFITNKPTQNVPALKAINSVTNR